MAKATKKTDAPTPRAGKKGAAAKSRKPPSKAEIASARNKDASGQDPSDGLSLNTRSCGQSRGAQSALDNHRQPERCQRSGKPFGAAPCQGHPPAGSEAR